MFVCPVCSRKFSEEPLLVKHYLACWKEHNSSHRPKEAPRSPDIESRTVNAETLSFFGGPRA